MKKALALVLLVSLVSAPSLAYAQAGQAAQALPAQVDGDTVGTDTAVEAETIDLAAAAAEAARAVVIEDALASSLAAAQEVPGRAGPGWRTAVGIAMLVGGAGIIWKGVDIYQDEPDRFDRTKNADAYLAYGVGAGIMGFGFITLKGGLEGRGF